MHVTFSTLLPMMVDSQIQSASGGSQIFFQNFLTLMSISLIHLKIYIMFQSMDKLMFKHFIMVNIYIIFSLIKLIVFSIYLASVFFFFFL